MQFSGSDQMCGIKIYNISGSAASMIKRESEKDIISECAVDLQ